MRNAGRSTKGIRSRGRPLTATPPRRNANSAGSRCRSPHLDQAFAHYQRAYQLNPNEVQAQMGLAKLLMMQEKPQEAIKYLRMAVQSDPLNGEAHYRLARPTGDLQMATSGKGDALVPGDQEDEGSSERPLSPDEHASPNRRTTRGRTMIDNRPSKGRSRWRARLRVGSHSASCMRRYWSLLWSAGCGGGSPAVLLPPRRDQSPPTIAKAYGAGQRGVERQHDSLTLP